MPNNVERWLNRKIDRTRAEAELAKPALPEITDPVEIDKKVERARSIFTQFLTSKLSRVDDISKKNIVFFITFDNMRTTLELSNVSSSIVREKMNEILLSVPGMTSTETGYTVLNPDLLYENFGPQATRNKILQFLSIDPDKAYTYQEIAEELKLSKTTISNTIVGLQAEGKVALVHKAARGRRGDSDEIKFNIPEQK